MDEASLIEAVLAAAGSAGATLTSDQVVVGPGDDAAVLSLPPNTDAVWSVDDQLEGVHFRRAWCSLESAGRKATGASISDLAAMGARPSGALLALGIPRGFSAEDALDLGRGVGGKLAESDCPLLGGNVSQNPGRLTISVSVLGHVPRGRALRRGAARPGDTLYVSGPLGWARLGLLYLEGGGDPNDPRMESAVAKLLDPTPRLDLGSRLAARGERLACMDLSDGLARDLPRLLRASGLAATVNSAELPAPREDAAAAAHQDPRELAWIGGEDYELLVASPADLRDLGLIPIGRVVDGTPGDIALEGPLAGSTLRGFDHLT